MEYTEEGQRYIDLMIATAINHHEIGLMPLADNFANVLLNVLANAHLILSESTYDKGWREGQAALLSQVSTN